MVQKIEKYIKLHVLGDFGDIWIGISEDIQKKSIIRVIEQKLLFFKNLM
jgi:hypothetical protein